MDDSKPLQPSAGTRLSLAQRQALLTIARWSLEGLLTDKADVAYQVKDPELERLAGAFVTLTRKGDLRGCVGYSDPLYPLHQAVSRCARSAATEDYRFEPVGAGELAELRISISVLSPLEKQENLQSIQVGRDGVLVVQAGGESRRRGLLLPQVATEQGWDREELLDGVCRKAGLPDKAWKDEGVDVFVFQAEVFSEDDTDVGGVEERLVWR